MNFLYTIFLILGIISICESQKDPHWITNRNTIVHLFEWKYNDIADECERFLQHKGYAGVQLSPVTENVVISNRPWWERYQPISYKLITRSGNEREFLNMTTRCNNVGIRIYVDLIINHMSAGNSSQVGTGGSTGDPGSQNYPEVPYQRSDFNPVCPVRPSDIRNNATAVRDCQLVGLNDLNQRKEHVRKQIVNFCNHLIDLGVAGFRIDAAAHMWPEDLTIIYDRFKNLNTSFGFAPNSKAFIYHEVIDLGITAVSRDEYTPIGLITEFRHSYAIGAAFRGITKLKWLSKWGVGWGFVKSSNGFVFVDNHDNQRSSNSVSGLVILTYKNRKEYIMAIAFMLAHPYGVTRIMSSFAFENSDAGPPQDENENIISPTINADNTCENGWVCEHRWREIYNMINFKNAVQQTEINNWWSDGNNQIAFCRGNRGFIAFTTKGNLSQVLNTCLPKGIYCDVISGNPEKDDQGQCLGKTVTVDADGKALIQIGSNEAGVLAIYL